MHEKSFAMCSYFCVACILLYQQSQWNLACHRLFYFHCWLVKAQTAHVKVLIKLPCHNDSGLIFYYMQCWQEYNIWQCWHAQGHTHHGLLLCVARAFEDWVGVWWILLFAPHTNQQPGCWTSTVLIIPDFPPKFVFLDGHTFNPIILCWDVAHLFEILIVGLGSTCAPAPVDSVLRSTLCITHLSWFIRNNQIRYWTRMTRLLSFESWHHTRRWWKANRDTNSSWMQSTAWKLST